MELTVKKNYLIVQLRVRLFATLKDGPSDTKCRYDDEERVAGYRQNSQTNAR